MIVTPKYTQHNKNFFNSNFKGFLTKISKICFINIIQRLTMLVEYISMHSLIDGDDDDEEAGNIVLSTKKDDTQVITPKWPTRVFAMECTRMILKECQEHPRHMDMALVRKMKDENPSGIILLL